MRIGAVTRSARSRAVSRVSYNSFKSQPESAQAVTYAYSPSQAREFHRITSAAAGFDRLQTKAGFLFASLATEEVPADIDGTPEDVPAEPEVLIDVAPGIKAKPEVVLDGVLPELKDKLGVIFDAYKKHGWADVSGNPLVITSGKDGEEWHKKNSNHFVGRALDLRGKHIPDKTLKLIAADIQKSLGKNYRAWAEFWKNPNRDHIHVEYVGTVKAKKR